jgi:hypothetical protein
LHDHPKRQGAGPGHDDFTTHVTTTTVHRFAGASWPRCRIGDSRHLDVVYRAHPPLRTLMIDLRECLRRLEDLMAGERVIAVELDDGTRMVVVAEQVGPSLVADTDVVAKLERVTGSIERVSREVLDALKRAAPTKATVELGFSLAVEEGQLVALLGKAKGEASLTVTLEWTKAAEPAPGG